MDSLCGVYVMLNALRSLECINTQEQSELAFRRLLRVIELKHPLSDTIVDGTDIVQLELMIRRVLQSDYCVQVERPFLSQSKDYSLDHVINGVSNFLEERKGVAIISIGGYHDHWSLVRRVTNNSFLLFDSDRMQRLSFKNTFVSIRKPFGSRRVHHLEPYYTRFLWVE
tara:strand:- start:190 stop:696 length:507 start_codon:yes stop_codon:yes gene_type:complete